MDITFILFLLPLIAWMLIAKLVLKHEFTLGEMASQFFITGIVLAGLVFGGYSSLTSDEMIVNGKVTGLNPVRKSCDMFWSDVPDSFCTNQYTRQVKNGKTCSTINDRRVCTPRYKTQYKSKYSWERRYFVETTTRDYEIDRVDAQGELYPPRFTSIEVGDPVATMVSYTNYIQGAASTLFNQKLEEIPDVEYPTIFDYYHVNQVLYTDLEPPAFLEDWNRSLEKLNSDLISKNVNVIINVTSKDETWAEALAQSWDAHNINDLVVVIGLSNSDIAWVDVRSWSSNELADVTIRDDILALSGVDFSAINDIIRKNTEQYYKQQNMEDFAYLKDDLSLPGWVYVLAGIVLLIATPAITLYLSKKE